MNSKESTNAFIGQNIELLLKENDMTQAELANRLGVSESAVGKSGFNDTEQLPEIGRNR